MNFMSDFLDLSSHRMHFRVDGPQDAPALIFCNSLGTTLHMWDSQIEALTKDVKVVRYDRRGHGLSTTSTTPFSIADLGQDVLALMDHLAIDQAHFCGLSIGGLVGQWLGTEAGERLLSLTVCATAAKIGTEEGWVQRAKEVRATGLAPLLEGTLERWFNPEFVTNQTQLVQSILDAFAQNSSEGYAQCCEALAQADFRAVLDKVTVPTLCVSGAEDPVCSAADLEFIATHVRQGTHRAIAGRHICNIESADDFNSLLRAFLLSTTK